jgi:replication initiation protein RepC
MQSHSPTTPFGRRSLTLAHVASQMGATARPPEKVVHKWNIFHAICTARPRLGVSERSLSVLNALLTFHPETALTGEDDLIVFPSNDKLTLRAHGMPASTLRRHLAVLVDAGLIIRRDSPNGKRYARKGSAGEIELAFGFDLSPLVVRSEEFEHLAADIEAEARALKLVRERITLCRRDIAKMIATGIEEGVPTRQGRAGAGRLAGSPRHLPGDARPDSEDRHASKQLEPIADELSQLADDVLNLLEAHIKSKNPSANESQSERHIQNSNTDPFIDLEPRLQEGRAARAEPKLSTIASRGRDSYPLGMVLSACPRHRRLRQGRHFELAGFPGHRGGCAIDAGDQPERLGGGANRSGRNAGGDRRRVHPAARRRDQISRRLPARFDAKSARPANFPLGRS